MEVNQRCSNTWKQAIIQLVILDDINGFIINQIVVLQPQENMMNIPAMQDEMPSHDADCIGEQKSDR